MQAKPPVLRVGLAGLGTVGAAVWRRLESQRELLRQRTGVEIRVDQVAVRRAERAREVGVPPSIVTSDYHDLLMNPELDVIIELIGGTINAHAPDQRRAAAGQARHHREQGAPRGARRGTLPARA